MQERVEGCCDARRDDGRMQFFSMHCWVLWLAQKYVFGEVPHPWREKWLALLNLAPATSVTCTKPHSDICCCVCTRKGAGTR
jgi:hypothetical protein